MKYAIGVDLGGTNIAVGLVDGEHRKILHRQSVKTCAPRSCEAIVKDICDLVGSVCAHCGIPLSEISWIGIGTPGIVKNGTVFSASNLGWNKEPLSEYIEKELGHPCYAANDANAAALAEALWGIGREDRSLVAITLGTGVGGGIVIDGEIWGGGNGCAAEIGCVIVNAETRENLEYSCSATALIREGKRMMALHRDSLMWRLCGGDITKVSAKTVFDAAEQNDFAAKSVVDRFLIYLSVGIANVINVFQPDVVCIGGGISHRGEALLVPLRKLVDSMAVGLPSEKTRLEIAAFQNDAGIIGAALLGMQAKRAFHKDSKKQ
jgi:glucokinase